MTTERKRTRAGCSTEPEASVPAAGRAPRYNELRWLRRIAGIAMVVLALWIAGQFFITKVFVLLVFAGIWALMDGISDIIRAFVLRGLPEPAESTAMAPPVRDAERGAGRAAAP